MKEDWESAIVPYLGHIEDGAVVLDEPVALPNGTQVRVEPVTENGSIHPDVIRVSGILPRNLDMRDVYAEGMKDKHT